MKAMDGARPALLACLLSLISNSVHGQAADGNQCPKITPKNPEEVVMMAASSDKDGCWVRDQKTGVLVFISNKAPDKNYKALLKQPPTSVPSPSTQGWGFSWHLVRED